jgi:hypothetical protein
VELRALPSRTRRFIRPDDSSELREFLLQHVRMEHCFFGVAARRDPGQGGGLSNCGLLGALWVDLDFKTTPEPEARRSVDSFAAPPSALVASGGGLHVYWLLDEPVTLPNDAPHIKATLRRLARALGGDLAAAEPARVLRLPYSLNFKYDPPAPVFVETLDPTRRYRLAQLEALLPPESEPATNGNRHFTLPPRIRDGERNTELHRYGRHLHARGRGPEEIAAMLEEANAARCEPPLAADEVAALAVKAAAQADAPGFRGRAQPATRGPILVPLADVEPQAVEWAWEGRVALGKMTLLIGDPGVGESFIALDIASCFTTGSEWPDGGAAPLGPVVLLSAEDGVADTIRPRVDALGGDPASIHVLKAVKSATGERSFSLKEDVDSLETAIASTDARLVIIDPLSAYFGNTESYKDTEVRGVLAPLASLAEQTGVAVVGIMHLTKDAQRRAIYRAPGSIAFIAAARIVLAVGKDPKHEGRRLLVSVKNNLGPAAKALAYSIPEGRLEWESEPVEGINADQLLGETDQPDDPSAREAAEELIREALRGGPVSAREVYQLARDQGISDRTLRYAKKALGVRQRRAPGPGTRWEWYLP